MLSLQGNMIVSINTNHSHLEDRWFSSVSPYKVAFLLFSWALLVNKPLFTEKSYASSLSNICVSYFLSITCIICLFFPLWLLIQLLNLHVYIITALCQRYCPAWFLFYWVCVLWWWCGVKFEHFLAFLKWCRLILHLLAPVLEAITFLRLSVCFYWKTVLE